MILKIMKLISSPDSLDDTPVIQCCIQVRSNHLKLKTAGAFVLKAVFNLYSLTAQKGN